MEKCYCPKINTNQSKRNKSFSKLFKTHCFEKERENQKVIATFGSIESILNMDNYDVKIELQ